MKRVLCGMLAVIIISLCFSTVAYGATSVLPTTQSFLNVLDKYDLPYFSLGDMVIIDDRIEEYDKDFDWFVVFSEEPYSISIGALVLKYHPEMYSLVLEICKEINTEYGLQLCSINQEESIVSFGHIRNIDNLDINDVGTMVLSLVLELSEIIHNEYHRFESVIMSNETEVENTPTVEPTLEPTLEPTSTPTPAPTPTPTNTPMPTEVPDWELVAQAEEIYNITNRYGRIWPADFDLAKEARVHSVRNINVVSCEIGTRSSSYSTVLFKGNFSGYDEYGMFVSKYTFTAEVKCRIQKSGYIDVDLVGANYKVQKVRFITWTT